MAVLVVQASVVYPQQTDTTGMEFAQLIAMADSLKTVGNYGAAYNMYEKANVAIDSTYTKQLHAYALGEEGVTCMYLGRYAKALECFQNSLKMREALGDSAE